MRPETLNRLADIAQWACFAAAAILGAIWLLHLGFS